tara:strand:- start:2977 stop:3180 length:204 start_codon:yes stop_codon:yes gene_type:complete
MSKLKDVLIGNEDKFWNIAQEKINDYDNFNDFEYALYMEYRDLVDHLYWEDVSDNLEEGWLGKRRFK